jgi:hypothetical protein
MDATRFEIFLRGTEFSATILEQLWLEMSTFEKVDFMLDCKQNRRYLPKKINMMALGDGSALIRMLASKLAHQPTEAEAKLINNAETDPNTFVRASCGFCHFEKIIDLPHDERLARVALTDMGLFGNHFADFITDNLTNGKLAEKEAMELVDEFVNNPAAARYLEVDDSSECAIYRDFNAIWNLTLLSPALSDKIIWKYPLVSGDGGTIPSEVLDKMSTDQMSKLIWRGYKPLIQAINKNPRGFDKKLVKDAIDAKRYSGSSGKRSETELLSDELRLAKTEILAKLDAVLTKSSESSGKRSENELLSDEVRLVKTEILAKLDAVLTKSSGWFK